MHAARSTALLALATCVSCGARTPLYAGDDLSTDGLPNGSTTGGRSSGDRDMGGRGDPGGRDDRMTGSGTGGPTGGTAGSSIAGGGSTTTTGAGGTTTTGPGDPGGPTGLPCGRTSIEDMIDDMNDGNRFIPSVNGRVGAWTVYHDDTPMVSMHPDFNDPFKMESTGYPCRLLAAHVYGGPFTVWGAGFGFGLGNPYDASGHYGITFWARSALPMTLQIAFPDQDTAVAGGLCDPGSTGSNGCYDHYSARRPIGAQWQKINVTFSELSQLGFGRRGKGFDPSTLYEIQFLIPRGAKFDVWVDDDALLLDNLL